MGLILGEKAAVKGVVRRQRGAAKGEVTEIENDPGGGRVVTSVSYQPAGFDSSPIPGLDGCVTVGVGGTGKRVALGFVNPERSDITAPGEVSLYARDGITGAAISIVHLRNDGTMLIFSAVGGNQVTLNPSGLCVVANGAGAIALEPSGEIDLNGAKISVAGEITNAAGVVLGTHDHDEGTHTVGVQAFTTDPPN